MAQRCSALSQLLRLRAEQRIRQRRDRQFLRHRLDLFGEIDAERAEIWEDASSLVAGIKMLLGFDPKKEYRDKVAEVRLS